MTRYYVDLAIPTAVDRLFTYSVPDSLDSSAIPGVRAIAPFGTRRVIGIIVSRTSSPPSRPVKPLDDVLDAAPVLSPELLSLGRWIGEYYHAPLGEVLRTMFAPGQVGLARTILRPAPGVKPGESTGRVLRAIIEKRKLTVAGLMRALGSTSVYGTIGRLRRQGAILIEEEPPPLRRRKRPGIGTEPEAGEPGGPADPGRTVEPDRGPALNNAQASAAAAIVESLSDNAFNAFLLRGVTGSGKTRVYIEAIAEALARGRSAIMLVPEIALTPQTLDTFRRAFGDEVAAFHSALSAGERRSTWDDAREGRKRIVIGPRSAIFAPLPDLGLIVVDEEHDASYKSAVSPRYHARDVALMRARECGSVVVLGSATPSVESYANALSGKYRLVELPERADGSSLPEVVIVDMTAERARKFEEYRASRLATVRGRRAGKDSAGGSMKDSFRQPHISDLLLGKIADRLTRKEGVILLQNRRGFASIVECPDCADVEKCERCGIPMTYHKSGRPDKAELRCHYCGSNRRAPLFCPNCGSGAFRLGGAGTQRIEAELARLLPGATIARMDSDTVSRRGSHGRILAEFSSGGTDILLGTQMIAKGLDIPRVTLVGVVNADTQLLLPDFRAAERTFQLLTQVAGRSGRRKIRGEVVIQTQHPDDRSVVRAARHDVAGFAAEELRFRRELGYPPYSRLTLIELNGKSEPGVRTEALRVAEMLRIAGLPGSILGPAPAAIGRVRGRYRWQLVIKSDRKRDPSGALVRELVSRALRPGRGSVRTIIDNDPQNMM